MTWHSDWSHCLCLLSTKWSSFIVKMYQHMLKLSHVGFGYTSLHILSEPTRCKATFAPFGWACLKCFWRLLGFNGNPFFFLNKPRLGDAASDVDMLKLYRSYFPAGLSVASTKSGKHPMSRVESKLQPCYYICLVPCLRQAVPTLNSVWPMQMYQCFCHIHKNRRSLPMQGIRHTHNIK